MSQSVETQLALSSLRQKAIEDEQVEINGKIAALQEERNHFLRWGIIVLGSAVVAMGVWIFNLIWGHVK